MSDRQITLPYTVPDVSRETACDLDTGTSYRLVSHRWELVRDASFASPTQYARSPEAAAQILLERVGSEPQEHFAVLVLSTRNQVLALDVVTVGTVNASIVSPATVYHRVLAHADAVACVVGHNHPSGDVEPSAEDRALTKRLHSAGKVLGVDVLDHVIVSAVAPGGPAWWSFKEHKEL